MTQAAEFYQQRAQAADPTLITTLGQAASNAGAAGKSQAEADARAIISPVAPTRPFTPVIPISAPVLTHPINIIDQPKIPIVAKIPLPPVLIQTRSASTIVGGKLVQFSSPIGAGPTIDTITSAVYAARIGLTDLPDILLAPQQPADLAMALPHDYYYVIPLALAECYQALGDYATAETYYLQCASYA